VSIGRDEVIHVARLAELAVKDDDLDRLVDQLNRIVDYVRQLDQLPATGPEDDFVPGPAQVALRADEPGSVPLARPPAAMAPEFAEGFFLVPRHAAMEASEDG
jgi:aspartyl-tRNA(Asn)/glutamyl-tRNA(Gln) amidotransferase subunit C